MSQIQKNQKSVPKSKDKLELDKHIEQAIKVQKEQIEEHQE